VGSPPEEPALDLTYPCPWTYGVIGRDEDALRAAIAEILGELEHTLRVKNHSSGGKYLTLEVEVVVPSNERRLELFRELHEHETVIYVL